MQPFRGGCSSPLRNRDADRSASGTALLAGLIEGCPAGSQPLASPHRRGFSHQALAVITHVVAPTEVIGWCYRGDVGLFMLPKATTTAVKHQSNRMDPVGPNRMNSLPNRDGEGERAVSVTASRGGHGDLQAQASLRNLRVPRTRSSFDGGIYCTLHAKHTESVRHVFTDTSGGYESCLSHLALQSQHAPDPVATTTHTA